MNTYTTVCKFTVQTLVTILILILSAPKEEQQGESTEKKNTV